MKALRDSIFVTVLILASASLLLAQQPPAAGQRRGLDPNTPRPIAAFDTVWIEEMTWMEVRDAVRAGKITVIIPAGSTEQNGPYVATFKHNYVLRLECESIARKLGNALVAPILPFEVSDPNRVNVSSSGSIYLRPEIFEGALEDVATSLKQAGFKHIILLGDSGGDQKGLQAVASRLSPKWAESGVTIHYIKEYYDSWDKADGSWESLGVPKKGDDGIHDDYSVNSIIAVLDPEKIRYKERVAAKKDSINGQPISPIDRTIANGKKLIELRADITVDAVKKVLSK